jgi:hypothetical protein
MRSGKLRCGGKWRGKEGMRQKGGKARHFACFAPPAASCLPQWQAQ